MILTLKNKAFRDIVWQTLKIYSYFNGFNKGVLFFLVHNKNKKKNGMYMSLFPKTSLS